MNSILTFWRSASFGTCGFVHGAAGEHDRLALEIASVRMLLPAAGRAASCPVTNIVGREGDELPPLGRVGRRSAFEVDIAGADEVDAVLRA
jgi:hypothetical protein